MDILSLIDAFKIFPHLSAFLLGMPRIFTAALVAPFLATSVVEGQIWFIMALGMYIPMHPVVMAQIPPELCLGTHVSFPLVLQYFCIIVKEVVIGLALGFLSGFPFWALQDAGIFIDNQRGASQSEGTEILSGKSVTPMGGILFQCLIYLFYSSGAFLIFLGLLYASYELWTVPGFIPTPKTLAYPLFFAGKVAWLMTFTLLLSAPVAVACLLIDIGLGLINRFSPQLNAYVLAMPIKSGLAAVLLTIYLAFTVNFSPSLFQYIYDFITTLMHMS